MFQYLVISHNTLGYGTIGSVMTPRNRAYWGLTYDISNIGLSNNGVYAAMLNPIFGWIGKLTEKGGHRPEYPLQNDAYEMGLSGNWS